MGRVSLLKRVSTALHVLRGTDAGYGDRWYEVYPGSKTLAGPRINEDTGLTISALFAALNFLASTMATLPRVVYRRLPSGGREHATDHPLYDRLHNRPNDEGMSAWQWVYTSLMHKYLWGSWYTHLQFSSYQDRQLIPLLPERMERYEEATKEYVYRLKNGQRVRLPQWQVLHIPHISLDGREGKGIVHYARESLGLAKAQEEFAGSFFGSGIKAGGFVQVPAGQPMNEETRQGLQKDFNEKYGELGRSWQAIFLSGGAEWKPNELDAAKAQALESRQFSVVEVARWTNLPPHVLRDLVRATFSNIEQQALELVVYSLLPIATQIEQAMNIRLFDDTERRTYYVKFELKGLLRGDLAARTAFYTAMLDRGVFNADTVLELEDMNPQPGGLGQVYVLPLNMINKQAALSTTMPALKLESHRGLPAPRRLIRASSAPLRRRLTLAYKPRFEQYARQLIDEEIEAIRAALKEAYGERDAAGFGLWLDEFYREWPARVQELAGPTLSAYATALLPVAQEEIHNEADLGGEYDAFLADYLEALAVRHVSASRQQLRSTLREAQEEGLDEREALEARLEDWDEKRPGKIVTHETIRAENALTRAVFAAGGVVMISSVALPPSCPYCEALDGTVIRIDEAFLNEGEFWPEGAAEPLKVTGTHRHPPYHAGCDCSVTAM